jgi:hypothetical protein
LPNSLRKLAISFDVENKSIFPYAFAFATPFAFYYSLLKPLAHKRQKCKTKA